ncbi:MAG: class I SAM-dependent methyltransferase [Pseudomonadota bacterium]
MSNSDDDKLVSDIPGLTPESYARWNASTLGDITEHLERQLIFELIGDARGRVILDVGCGDGGLAVELSRRGAHVTGLDSSETMIAAAKDRAGRSGTDSDFLVATAQDMPFPPDQFDVVIANTVLCFVKNASPVFAEMSRVLRPGGHLVVGELGKWSTWAASRRVRGWIGSPLWRKAKFRTPEELRALARSVGLTDESVRGAIYYPKYSLTARLLARCDRRLSRMTAFGAAFLALQATKPDRIDQVDGDKSWT